MAEKKKKRTVKKSETVREKANKQRNGDDKQPRRISRATKKVTSKAGDVAKKGRKHYYLPLPDNKAANWLNKPRHIVPGPIRRAWQELKGVTWPNRSETFRLTVAVLLFAMFFGSLIAAIDYGLEIVFERIILGL